MKKIICALVIILTANQSTHSMWQRAAQFGKTAWTHTKTAGRIGGGAVCIIGAGATFLEGNKFADNTAKSAEEIIERIKNIEDTTLRNECLKNLSNFSDQLKNRLGIPDCKINIVDHNTFATVSSLNNRNRHVLLMPLDSFNSTLAGKVDLVRDAICLHEGVHMRNQDNSKSQASKVITSIATGAIYFKQMPARFKIPALLLATQMPQIIHNAFCEDRADEDGPLTLGTKEEVEAWCNSFNEIEKNSQNNPSFLDYIIDYHPATSHRIKRAEKRIQYLEAQEQLDAKIKQATTQAEINDLKNQKEQLEDDWKNNSTTLGRMRDGLVAHFKKSN